MMRWMILALMPLMLSAKIGTVSAFRSEVTIERGAQRLAVGTGFGIEQKDVMYTGEKSRAQMIMEDEAVITVGENSIYRFTTYDVGEARATMELKRGFFRTITGKIGKIAPKRFKIKTRSATIGIRGTHLAAEVGSDYEKIWCFRGAITVDTPDKHYEIEAGKMIVFRQGVWRVLPATDLSARTRPVSPLLDSHQNQLQEKVLDATAQTIPADDSSPVPFDPND